MRTTRKQRLFPILILAILLGSIACTPTSDQKADNTFNALELFPEPPRPAGQSDVIELRCDPIETVRVAFIGLGNRGKGAVSRFTFLEGVEIVALCDVIPENVEKTQGILEEKDFPKADGYTGAEDWKTICEREDIDLIYICTHWDLHTPIAVICHGTWKTCGHGGPGSHHY